MAINIAAAPASLDVGTLFFIAICVTALLGLFLLFAWTQERIQALAWWGVAYLLGGASGALWRWGDLVAPGISSLAATTLLFVAVGMIWSAARLFHGRPVRRGIMLFGAAFWLAACFVPAFTGSAGSRLVVSALIVAGYTILTATELRLERRKSLIRRWPRDLRSNSARHNIPPAGGAGYAHAGRRRRPQLGARLDRRIRHRDRSLPRRHRLHRADPGEGSDCQRL